MSYADDLKSEIDALQKKLQDLDRLRLERDHIIKQKSEAEKAIEDLKTTIDNLIKETSITKALKDAEDTRSNLEIKNRLLSIQVKEQANNVENQRLMKISQDNAHEEMDISSQRLKNKAQSDVITEKEQYIIKQDKSLREAESRHTQDVLEHEKRVSDLHSRETALIVATTDVKKAQDNNTRDRKAIEAELILISKSHAEINKRKTFVDDERRLVIARTADLDRRETFYTESFQELEKKRIDHVTKEKELDSKNIVYQTASDNLTLRELECQAKERALEKRERLIILKENGGQ